MATLCAYFQVHQPYRLRKFSFFEIGEGADYFDEALNELCMRRAAERCYIPANKIVHEAILRSEGALKVAFSITGTALEQMKCSAPEALESFQKLAATGSVEFLAETYYHSLAALYDAREFVEQVELHRSITRELFGREPVVFRNTELLYSDAIAEMVAPLGFKGILAEGAEKVLGWRSPNHCFRAQGTGMPLLLKNYRLSDDIAFRFGHAGNEQGALTPEEFVRRLNELPPDSDTVGLFLDYETFGEHHDELSSIQSFLRGLPQRVLADSRWKFCTPEEICRRPTVREEISFPSTTSWADESRDASAWNGNAMQQRALEAVYGVREAVSAVGDSTLLETWRRLQTSDHFYYMSTKGGPDGMVHSHFSPFESPYEAFMAFMNVMKDFAQQLVSR